MFTVTTVPTASSDTAIDPLIGFTVDVDGECLAPGELLNASWIDGEAGQVITVRWEDGRAEAARTPTGRSAGPLTLGGSAGHVLECRVCVPPGSGSSPRWWRHSA